MLPSCAAPRARLAGRPGGFVTNERLVGFTSLLGDFSSKALGTHERITRLGIEQGLIIVTTNTGMLVFGSRLSGWEEFE